MSNEFVIVKNAFDIDTRAYFSDNEEFANKLAEILSSETGYDWKVYKDNKLSELDSVFENIASSGVAGGFMTEDENDEEELEFEEAAEELVEYFFECFENDIEIDEDVVADISDVIPESEVAFIRDLVSYHLICEDFGIEPDPNFIKFIESLHEEQ